MDKKNEENRQHNCRYCHPFMGRNHDETHCVADGWEDDKVKTVTLEDCENCEKYKSRYIEYPITVSKINQKFRKYGKDEDCGRLVKIRPCGKEYGGKTYLGFLLGDLPFMLYITHNPETLELSCSTTGNPAIFVPELGKIIFGMESWWEKIKSEEELKDITDDDIENVWYVKMLKGMGGGRMNNEQVIHCLRVYTDETVCEECDFYPDCTHETQSDMARVAISAIKKTYSKTDNSQSDRRSR